MYQMYDKVFVYVFGFYNSLSARYWYGAYILL